MSDRQTAAINAIPGMTKINYVHDDPSSEVKLFWFDCEEPGRSVVGFPANDTFLILMDGPSGKAFVDPNDRSGMSFVAFPNEAIRAASTDLVNFLVAHHFGGKP